MLLATIFGLFSVVTAQLTKLQAFDYLCNAIDRSPYADEIKKSAPISSHSDTGYKFPASYTPAQRLAALFLSRVDVDGDKIVTTAPDGSVIQAVTPGPPHMREYIEEHGGFESFGITYTEKGLDEFFTAVSNRAMRSESEKADPEDDPEDDDTIEMTRLQAFNYLSNLIEDDLSADTIKKVAAISDGYNFPASYTPAQRLAAVRLSYHVVDNNDVFVMGPDGSILRTMTNVPPFMKEQFEKQAETAGTVFTKKELKRSIAFLNKVSKIGSERSEITYDVTT